MTSRQILAARFLAGIALLATVLAPLAQPASADEGLWTFDAFPKDKVRAAYGWAPDDAFLARLQKTSVRLGNGCSGSIVSKTGLVLTNHHCITECVQDLSTARRNYLTEGFVAARPRDEKICPGLDVDILQTITDVTRRVKAASGREGEIARIEDEACGDDANKVCQVVSLYRGGVFNLYVFDRYSDVRIAFAPEGQAAQFGGDPDNFNFPRYAFDMALIRLYRNGRAITVREPLQMATSAPKEGELVFAPGNPYSTDRSLTVSQLEYQRDTLLPWRLEYGGQLRGMMLGTSARGEEEARQISEALYLLENSMKVWRGEQGALADRGLLARKRGEEQKLRDALASAPGLRAKYGDPFADLERLTQIQAARLMPYQMLESRFGEGSQLLQFARALVRNAGSNDVAFARYISAETAVNPVLEKLLVEFWLLKTREYLGADHPAVRAMFGSRTAAQVAADVIDNSSLIDPSARQRYLREPRSVDTSNDPAIQLARLVDSSAREAQRAWLSDVQRPVNAAAERVAGLRLEVLGQGQYPDATFTPRVTYGAVKGWKDPQRGEVPAFTQVGGLWQRATGASPFDLAPNWQGKKSVLDAATPMNFSLTTDSTGGSSGSPVVDRQGRVVGVLFDGNIHSIGGAYGFDPALNRSVALTSVLMIEGLRKVYQADALADELSGK